MAKCGFSNLDRILLHSILCNVPMKLLHNLNATKNSWSTLCSFRFVRCENAFLLMCLFHSTVFPFPYHWIKMTFCIRNFSTFVRIKFWDFNVPFISFSKSIFDIAANVPKHQIHIFQPEMRSDALLFQHTHTHKNWFSDCKRNGNEAILCAERVFIVVLEICVGAIVHYIMPLEWLR